MNSLFPPWQLLLLCLAGWVNREQQAAIDYLRTENTVLREHLAKKRILLTDDQRLRLAVKGKILGRKLLEQVGTLFTPDTILRWHRQLVARKWDYSDLKNKVGRPRIRQVIVDLILRFAHENTNWGCDRIQGALANVGYHISDTTVENVLKQHGIEPAPNRKTSLCWSTFLKAHWETLFATDFTTVEVWTPRGLVTHYIMVVMELKSRRVEIAGITTNPHATWMRNITKELTNDIDGFMKDASHLIMDRDTSFITLREFLDTKTETEAVLLPPRSPNLNSFQERFFRSLKSECLDRMIFFSPRQLRRALKEYVTHYHTERNHQGLDNQLIEPDDSVGSVAGKIECSERLGGMLKYYHRAA
ncbi:MAG: integrase core domain-containing protein [Planctomycetaceae bacterium]|nr:integrase core domain-containing protein [Planctomycetaceae bacterium]